MGFSADRFNNDPADRKPTPTPALPLMGRETSRGSRSNSSALPTLPHCNIESRYPVRSFPCCFNASFPGRKFTLEQHGLNRKCVVEGKRGSERLDLGGGRIIKKK